MATLAHFLSQPVGKPVEDITTSNVTFYTNGPINSSDPATAKFLTTLSAHHISLDTRPVVRLEPSTDPTTNPGLTIHLRNPNDTISSTFLAFLYHKPPTAPSCPDLISQLGLALEQGPFGQYIKTTGPLQSTSVPGVFACGDAGTMLTQSTVAMASGNAVAGGVAHYVAELDDEIAVERYTKGRRETVASVQDGEGGEPVACAVDS